VAWFLLCIHPMLSHPSILLVDDSPGECELFRQALAQTGFDVALYTEQDAEAAVHFLADRARHDILPSVILLDWNLHKSRGDTFLWKIRSDSRFATIPVVVFTTSDDSTDLAAGYRSGANGYVVKPGTYADLVRFSLDFCRYWLTWNRTLHSIGMQC
jgi:DNA-binding response OmpR family regulator